MVDDLMWIIAWLLAFVCALLAVVLLVAGIVLATVGLIRARRVPRDVLSTWMTVVTLIVCAATLFVLLGSFASFYAEI